jgi:Transposase DDE domain
MYLVTNLLDEEQLSRSEAVEIYRRRWGIEVFHRHCKQTFERRKLRSHNPDNAMIELHWSLLGMWAMGLHSHTCFVAVCVPNASASPACFAPTVDRCANTKARRIPMID